MKWIGFSKNAKDDFGTRDSFDEIKDVAKSLNAQAIKLHEEPVVEAKLNITYLRKLTR